MMNNIVIISLALLFLFLAISKGFKTAEAQKQEKIQKFMNMSFSELGFKYEGTGCHALEFPL